MDKKLLLEKYVKVAVRKALEEEKKQQQKAERSMYLVYRFPKLKKLMEELMSPIFARYINEVSIVAPKPTTFKVSLINGQDFNLIYLGRGNFNVKIAGKKYYSQNNNEMARASQAIANILALNYSPQETEEETKAKKNAELAGDLGSPGGGSIGGSGGFPGENPFPELDNQSPDANTPIPGEETPGGDDLSLDTLPSPDSGEIPDEEEEEV